MRERDMDLEVCLPDSSLLLHHGNAVASSGQCSSQGQRKNMHK